MLSAKHKTGLVFFPAFDWAISPTHPEREERLLYTQDQVVEEGLFDIEGISEGLDLLISQPLLRKKMGEAGRKMVEIKYNRSKIVDQFFDFLTAQA